MKKAIALGVVLSFLELYTAENQSAWDILNDNDKSIVSRATLEKTLPIEVLMKIAGYLMPEDLARLAQASKRLQKLAKLSMKSMDFSHRPIHLDARGTPMDSSLSLFKPINAFMQAYAGPQLHALRLYKVEVHGSRVLRFSIKNIFNRVNPFKEDISDFFKWELLKKCTGLKRVDASNCHLKDIPAEFSTLTHLQEIDLSSNNLAAAKNWDALSRNVEQMNLSHCRLVKLPDQLSSFNSLTKLDVSSNNVITKWPNELTSSLDEVNLNHCDLSQLPSFVLKSPKLKKLDLAGNWRLEALPERIASIALEKLDISCCDLMQLPALLAAFQSLKELNISFNFLSHRASSWALVSKQLEELTASGCRLEDLPEEFRTFHALKKLDISNNHLSSARWQNLPPSIRYLDVSGCEIQGMPSELATLIELVVLDLSNNFLSESNFNDLKELPNLKELVLNNCGINQRPALIPDHVDVVLDIPRHIILK